MGGYDYDSCAFFDNNNLKPVFAKMFVPLFTKIAAWFLKIGEAYGFNDYTSGETSLS